MRKRRVSDEAQIELDFGALPPTPPCSQSQALEKKHELTPLSSLRLVQPYKDRNGDRRFKQRVKAQRGSTCEACGQKLPVDCLHVHHIILTKTYPEFAREEKNVLALCGPCHTSAHWNFKDLLLVRRLLG
jgi:hypothetical protein